jgi:UDP-N-acetylmuramoyl-tripeptide--D-alanyl-D-alanine ligase
VLEMAMSASGEIRRLTGIAPPDVAVITNIHPVHLAFFEGLEGIARAKKEILDGAKKSAKAVLNGDDPRVVEIGRGFRGDRIFFGLGEGCDVRAERVEFQGLDGISFELKYGSRRAELRLPFLTDSYLLDFLAAAGAALARALPLEEVQARAAELRTFPRRGEIHRLARDIVLVDDSYNSNPRALAAALAGLGRLPAKRKVAVLGDMLELGPREAEFHEQAGRDLAAAGWDQLITVGPLSRGIARAAVASGLEAGRCLSFDEAEEAALRVPGLLQPGDLVLVKGSHGIHTDKVADRILEVLKES